MIPKAPLYLALIHYPVYNSHGQIVCTSITPFDLHDIARTVRTYGLAGYFVVCPVESQRVLAHRITDHWVTGVGGDLNQTRRDAFSTLHLVADLHQAEAQIQEECGQKPGLIATSAKWGRNRSTFPELKDRLLASSSPHLLLFGTGWGMAQELLDQCQGILAPIAGGGDGSYNHLPVRAAVAIILDRLLASGGR
jgi:hypothetical protein